MHSDPGMNLCASCGMQLAGEANLCAHHDAGGLIGWAVSNRIMCDFFHRGIVPSRLCEADRDDDLQRQAA